MVTRRLYDDPDDFARGWNAAIRAAVKSMAAYRNPAALSVAVGLESVINDLKSLRKRPQKAKVKW